MGPSPAPGVVLGSSVGKRAQRDDHGGCGPKGGGTGFGSYPGSQVPSSSVSPGARGAVVLEGGPGLAAPCPQAERGGQPPRGRRAPPEGSLEGRCQPLLAGKGPLGLRHRHRPFGSRGPQCPGRSVGHPPRRALPAPRDSPPAGPRAPPARASPGRPGLAGQGPGPARASSNFAFNVTPCTRAETEARGRACDGVNALVSQGFLAQPATVPGRCPPPAARGTLGIIVPGRAPFTRRPRPRRPLADAGAGADGTGGARPAREGPSRDVRVPAPPHAPPLRPRAHGARTERARQPPGPR